MQLKILTLTGDELEIDVEKEDTIRRVKEKIEEREGIPPVQQRLIHEGKQLKDDKSVGNYKLRGGTTLHLVIALRGGFQRGTNTGKNNHVLLYIHNEMRNVIWK